MLRNALHQVSREQRRGFVKLILIMKSTILLLLVACLAANATGRAQTITLTEHNATLESVFKKISEQSPYTFVYRDEWMRQARRVTIDVRNASLQQVLSACFREQPLTYTVIDNAVVIKQKEVEVKKTDAPE